MIKVFTIKTIKMFIACNYIIKQNTHAHTHTHRSVVKVHQYLSKSREHTRVLHVLVNFNEICKRLITV